MKFTLEECEKLKIPLGNAKDITNNKYGLLTPLFRVVNSPDGRTQWACKCDCGNYIITQMAYLRSGRIKTCGCFRQYKDLTGQTFGELTVLRPYSKGENRSIKWLCQCSCGELHVSRSDTLRASKHPKCNNHYHNMMVGKQFGELTVIKYLRTENYKSIFLCQCSCGKLKEVQGNQLQTGNTRSCGCMGNSIGEKHIIRVLEQNDIKYIQNKTFETCKFPDTHYPAYFDFYIKEQNMLIEFDGKQHFDKNCNWGGVYRYKQTHSHDLFKNKWAWDNHITLKRIPFTERDNITLSLVMSDQYLITPDTHPEWYPEPGTEYPYWKEEEEENA